MATKNNKIRFIDEEKTKELQKDWKGYGKSQVLLVQIAAHICKEAVGKNGILMLLQMFV